MTTPVEKQATVIRNYDAHSSDSVDQVETTDTLTNKRPLNILTGEGAEQQDNIAMETIVIENRDTISCDSIPGTPLNNAKAVSKEGTSFYSSGPLDSSGAKERSWDLKPKSEAETDSAMCTVTVIENRDAENGIIASSEPIATVQHGGPRDLELKEGTTSSIPKSADLESHPHTSVASDDVDAGNSKKSMTSAKRHHVAENGSREAIDKGMHMEGDLRGGQKKQLPKDILFFMRDEQSQTQLKQV